MAARRRTVVFDLDDTLYAERDYVRSGLAAVADYVKARNAAEVAIDDLPDADPLGAISRRFGISLEELLGVYRLHRPVIRPHSAVQRTIAACRARGEAVCILTDGRSAGQRLKLAALGIDHDEAFVSEEVGAQKPSPVGYRLVERRWPAQSFVYVADNPLKDFIAPNALGWSTIGLRLRQGAVHRWCEADLAPGAAPGAWADDFDQVEGILSQPVHRS